MKTLHKIYLVTILALLPLGVNAQWSDDSNVNTQISIHPRGELIPSVIPTGDGGMIVVWGRFRTIQHNTIIAQKFDASGVKQWEAEGVPAFEEDLFQARDFSIVSDGDGGVIIAVCENLDGIISFQRIGNSGVVLWGAQGISLATDTQKHQPQLVPDNEGGAILVYREDTEATQSDIMAQRISADGNLLWGNGLPICSRPGDQDQVVAVSDQVGGAVLSWRDLGTAFEMYAQRIDNSGTLLWAPAGVLVSDNLTAQNTEANILYHDGTYLLWMNADAVFLQKLTDDGQIAYEENGRVVILGANVSTIGRLAAGDGENVFLTWDHFTDQAVRSSYIQKFNGAGEPLWDIGGVEYNVTSDFVFNPSVVGDGADGVIICYTRKVGPELFDIYAQKLNGNAQPQWQPAGIPVGTNPTGIGRGGEMLITSDTAGGAILTWVEAREPTYDVFAQRICSQGVLGNCTLGLQNFANTGSVLYPNPANSTINIEATIKFTSARIYNNLGQLVLQTDRPESAIDVSGLAGGSYIIKLISDSETTNARFIKN